MKRRKKNLSRKRGNTYVCTERQARDEGRRLASRTENRRQPERMRVVIIRAPVKSSPFIPGSFTFRILPHPSPSLFVLRIFHDPRNISSMRCGTPRSFSRMRERSQWVPIASTLTSLVARKRGKDDEGLAPCELLNNLLSSSLSSTHNKFIKHCEAAAPCDIKRRGGE